MNIAVFGGTHGNEPVGVEVVRALERLSPKSGFNTYKTFIGNPEALKQKKRYIDSDLNRAFGKNAKPRGYEKKRAQALTTEIKGNYDFIIDLHTTTTNMGLTAILNNTHETSRQTCCHLKNKIPNFRLIEEIALDGDCTHLGRLAPAGVTIEVGPVPNNVVSGRLVEKTYAIVLEILNFDFEKKYAYSETEVYKTVETLRYPKGEGWYIHPDLEGNDFKPLKPGTPIFTKISGEIVKYEGSSELFPFFINEAAYLEHGSAMILGRKTLGNSNE